jgi:branched-chain amino acid transport system permease protein
MRFFFLTLLNGLTLAALYFLVASGFTLVFGLMRNVNLAHGSLYLLGGYIGFSAAEASGSWFIGIAAGFLSMALLGVTLQTLIFRRMEGQDLRQTLVTIGLSIVLADLMLWIWGGETYQCTGWLMGTTPLPLVRLCSPIALVLGAAIVIGIGLWLLLDKTRIGMMIRAGVDVGRCSRRRGERATGVCPTFAIGADQPGWPVWWAEPRFPSTRRRHATCSPRWW